MKNRLALLVVTAAAVGLVLTGCGRGPGTEPMAPSIDGTWVFTGFSAEIAVPDVKVTIGDGMTPLSADQTSRLAAVTKIVAKGTLTLAGTTYKLALAEGADAIIVTLAMPSPELQVGATAYIKTLIEGAQDGDVGITVSDDMMMITVKGSFLDMLAAELGVPVPEEGLEGCKNAPCGTMGS